MTTLNVALNKSATTSTVLLPNFYGSKFAVDGRVVLEGLGTQCTHSDNEFNPWIVIDLGAIYNPKYVTLFNRIDDHGKLFYHTMLKTTS
jgi:hypothetical protein